MPLNIGALFQQSTSAQKKKTMGTAQTPCAQMAQVMDRQMGRPPPPCALVSVVLLTNEDEGSMVQMTRCHDISFHRNAAVRRQQKMLFGVMRNWRDGEYLQSIK